MTKIIMAVWKQIAISLGFLIRLHPVVVYYLVNVWLFLFFFFECVVGFVKTWSVIAQRVDGNTCITRLSNFRIVCWTNWM